MSCFTVRLSCKSDRTENEWSENIKPIQYAAFCIIPIFYF
ncbi:hypothetical protein TPE_2516 [Treponema pedis str. T A4]|uniref:Uncharacterized protein n=1 Tax=Treponema pedis str. T A4 TaxID=1291379 RepID=S6A1Y7_9SPIR|nr:hypothetical protein TPE_2516 [Treponema pedis str. T A4]